MNAESILQRESMPQSERELFARDIRRTADEYFETDGVEVDVTRTPNGYSVCILLAAKRIKRMKSI